jgi:four helix bundle protein
MTGDIRDRTFEFAVKIIQFTESLPRTTSLSIITKQLIRAGLSIGANVEEAKAASSRIDFSHRMGIALREGRETLYWLRIVKALNVASPGEMELVISEADQIARILGAIVSSTRGTRRKT